MTFVSARGVAPASLEVARHRAIFYDASSEWLIVLAHSAGVGIDHPSMRELGDALARTGLAVLLWEFAYKTAGKKLPDKLPSCVAQSHEVWQAAKVRWGKRLVAGGRSFGGRMASHAALTDPLAEKLVYFGFPLHPAKQPGVARAAHLGGLSQPMLFVSGTRDALAMPALLTAEVAKLPRARLAWIDGADHGLSLAKHATGDTLASIAQLTCQWILEK